MTAEEVRCQAAAQFDLWIETGDLTHIRGCWHWEEKAQSLEFNASRVSAASPTPGSKAA